RADAAVLHESRRRGCRDLRRPGGNRGRLQEAADGREALDVRFLGQHHVHGLGRREGVLANARFVTTTSSTSRASSSSCASAWAPNPIEPAASARLIALATGVLVLITYPLW